MTETLTQLDIPKGFPDHTQLPDRDNNFVKNFQEHPQSIILTDSLTEVLQKLHPNQDYCIGQDCGIYWRETEPPETGAVAPDWFYVPNVPAKLDGKSRRSYVLWREFMAPWIVLEFASANGEEERDRAPLQLMPDGNISKPGKFWVYEKVIRSPYYAIYEINHERLEAYHLVDFSYQKIELNERGHYPIPHLGVELGLWQGSYQNQTQMWLRWWDLDGNLLLTGHEQAGLEKLRVEQEKKRADKETQKAEQEKKRADKEKKRADQENQKLEALLEKLRSIDPAQLQALGIELND